jgi:hypothetical protein
MRRLVTLGGIAAAIAATMVLATPLRAQVWDDDVHVPPGHRPPAGMCRVWYDNVPPGRQPRATDCSTAELVAARHGARVLYGDRARHGKKRRDDRRYVTIDGRRCTVTESRNGDWARYDCRRRDDQFPWDGRSSRDRDNRDRDDRDRDGRYGRDNDDREWHRAPDGRYCTASYEYCRKDEPLPQRVDQRGIPRNDTRVSPPGTPRIEPRERTRESIKPNGR